MKTKYRSIFLSDLHLGSSACKDHQLLKFLKNHQCENLYLVGDVIDCWRLRRKFYWPDSHNDIIRAILKMAARGTRVYYIVGNHDEVLRQWLPFFKSFSNIQVVNEIEHNTLDQQRLLVVHGDMFDSLMQVHGGKLLMHVGDRLYDWLIIINNFWGHIRRLFGLPYWSMSKAIKHSTKQIIGHINQFEMILVNYCKSRGYSGIVCGHIHTAAIKEINGLKYYNCGDWIENCSAIVEKYDGSIELKFFG